MKNLKPITTLCLVGLLSASIAQTNPSKRKAAFAAHHKGSTTVAQAKTSDLYAPARSLNYFWDNMANQWSFSDTSFYTYNSAGDISVMLNRNGTTMNRILSTYDSKGRLTEELYQNYTMPGSSWIWVDNFKNVYIYDSHDNLIESSSYTNSGLTNQWNISYGSRNLYVYGNNNQITMYTAQSWNSSQQVWEDNYRQLNYVYNSSGNLIQFETQNMYNNVWVNDSRFNDSYSTSNVLVEEIVEVWNSTAFEKSERYTNLNWHNWTGDPNTSTVSSYTWQSWGTPAANQWNIAGRSNTIYDSNGGSVETDETYNNGTWENDYRYTESYDVNKNYTGYKDEIWDSSLNIWGLDYEYKITHYYAFGGSKNISKSIWQYWDNSSMSLVNDHMKEYLDYSLVSGISENSKQSELQISVYPNPFNEYCTLKINSKELAADKDLNLNIYDMLGNIVSQSKFVEQETRIQKGNLQAGIYVYSITNKNAILHQGKLIVE